MSLTHKEKTTSLGINAAAAVSYCRRLLFAHLCMIQKKTAPYAGADLL